MAYTESWGATVRSTGSEELRQVIRDYPILDNHAHNLLRRSEINKHDFESITTEAHGAALQDTYSSLPHIRAAVQLRELYGTDAHQWGAIKQVRQRWIRTQWDDLHRRCFEGIHTILMDDGLDPDMVEDYGWHDTFTTGPTRRIVRIEVVAEQLLQSILHEGGTTLNTWRAAADNAQPFLSHFKSRFLTAILTAIADPKVAGFKSVICYRSGLDVQLSSLSEDPGSGLPVAAFREFAADCARTGTVRLNHKQLNDWVLCLALQGILSAAKTKYKPIQFHTGLGDNDMSLHKSNPAYLQPLIEAFPEIQFVLLHAAYPYTREAGYLACVFSNVYLDIGEVFPMISRGGQVEVIQQALELVPGKKILWSTDGHWFPETYWLAVKQWRVALEAVLVQYVEHGDLTNAQAIELAKDIMFENSNRLYRLGLDAGYVPRSTTTSIAAPSPNPASAVSRNPSVLTTTPLPVREPADDQSLDWMYLQWIDYMGTMRTRMLPIKQFRKVLFKEAQVSMSYGNLGTLQDDYLTPVVNTTGQVVLRPDRSSFRRTHKQDSLRRPGVNGGPSSKTGSVFANWHSEDGNPLPGCPRGTLTRLLRTLKTSYGLTMQLGFELEVYFLKSVPSSTTAASQSFEPPKDPHAWSTLSAAQWANTLPLLRDIANALADMDIEIQQMHAESGPGQWEFVLPPAAPLHAIDTMYQARTAIQQIAHLNGLRATFHPAPFLANSTTSSGVCSGAHIHMSFQRSDAAQSPSLEETSFLLHGVLPHLASIAAFTLPASSSYARVRDGAWTGGSWIAWGTQNREVPLRRVGPNRWELRCVDGMANMYLAVAAVVAAGLVGLAGPSSEDAAESSPSAPLKDCPFPPHTLTAERRAEYNIAQQMPDNIKAALTALEFDAELVEVLGKGLVGDYVAMKECEVAVSGWGEEDDGGAGEKGGDDDREERRRRRVAWEIERY